MPKASDRSQSLAFLAGGGELGERIRSFDWSKTPLGQPETWPESLRASLGICLSTEFPIAIYFGLEATLLYNDAWHPILGDKHPWALGRSGREVWSEIWDVVGPVFERAMNSGRGSFFKDALLSMHRFGYTEECYFDYTFSPIRGQDEKIEGVFNAVNETTFRVLGDRRGELLRQLAANLATTKQEVEACTLAAQALDRDPSDVPFALFYLLDRSEAIGSLAASLGFEEGSIAAPAKVDLVDHCAGLWPIATAVRTGIPQRVAIKSESHGRIAGGPWPEPPREALVVPVSATGRGGTAAVLVLGVSPRRALDKAYTDFLVLVAAQVGTAIANARNHEEERERAKALAELDKAKTEFFSNISHEFRTPLTLMLGPIEDMLEKGGADLNPAHKAQLEIVHRNSLRLMKLVNTMLDFSRIEAGRAEANFEEVDLATFTAELASVFRSATERAGMKLIVDCAPIDEPVFIDREMWEKIVLNLLSNAFKFTLAGEIEVKLDQVDREARLLVRDTGIGIPKEELPRVFERFHRVKESRGRTHEGTGIGLALVQELVHLHGGSIRVESAIDQGSRFIVSLPLGRNGSDVKRAKTQPLHRPHSISPETFAKETMRWTAPDSVALVPEWEPIGSGSGGPDRDASRQPNGPRPRILWADDNADMRAYVKRLLEERYEVTTVSDGQAALDSIRASPPELVLSDVMMPKLDGFGLLGALRADPVLRTIPVILLSARAGEEARVGGITFGADDYLVKPFSSRELLARVDSHVKMARFRRESQVQVEKLNHDLHAEIADREEAHKLLRQRTAQFETLLSQAPIGVYVIDSDFRLREVNPTARLVFGDIPDLIGRSFDEVIRILWPNARANEIIQLFRHTLETGESYSMPEFAEERADRGGTEHYEWRIDRIPVPDGRYGVVAYFRDISEQVRARRTLKGARDDALAANRAKDEFLATLSHELRTPLNPALLVASDAADNLSLPEDIRADFRMIANNISLQARLIDDLLDFSRIVHGKVVLERRPLDLHAIVREAAATIQGEIADKRIELTLSFPLSSPVVDGDPVRLRQVFWNVLKNAYKFTPAGGRIEIASGFGPEGEGEIRVRDSGIGMRAEELSRIFFPFVQGRHVDGNSQERYGGLGLGLAISRMLIEQHSGTISAESPGPNMGSTFIIRVPLKVPAKGSTDAKKGGNGNGSLRAPSMEDFPVLRVLFVEDHDQTRETLTRLLKRRGYDVKTASTIQEALRSAEQDDYDLLISDLGLPDGDGCNLMSELRVKWPTLLGVAISGFGMEADVTRSRAAGFNEHLTKPVGIDSLDRALSRLRKR
jgi:PAS domain S-box-containing protein